MNRPARIAAILFLMTIGASTPAWVQSRTGSEAYQQPLRPQFHWSPRTDFTNDPNGLFYYKGEYHPSIRRASFPTSGTASSRTRSIHYGFSHRSDHHP